MFKFIVFVMAVISAAQAGLVARSSARDCTCAGELASVLNITAKAHTLLLGHHYSAHDVQAAISHGLKTK